MRPQPSSLVRARSGLHRSDRQTRGVMEVVYSCRRHRRTERQVLCSFRRGSVLASLMSLAGGWSSAEVASAQEAGPNAPGAVAQVADTAQPVAEASAEGELDEVVVTVDRRRK